MTSRNRALRRAVTGLGQGEPGPTLRLRTPSPGVSFMLKSAACAQGMG